MSRCEAMCQMNKRGECPITHVFFFILTHIMSFEVGSILHWASWVALWISLRCDSSGGYFHRTFLKSWHNHLQANAVKSTQCFRFVWNTFWKAIFWELGTQHVMYLWFLLLLKISFIYIANRKRRSNCYSVFGELLLYIALDFKEFVVSMVCMYSKLLPQQLVQDRWQVRALMTALWSYDWSLWWLR